MGILDDAIREHLDLKRKHGARDSEISEIEDEALGSGDRPDPFAAGELFGNVSAPGAPAQEAPAQELSPPTPPPDGLEEQPPEEEPTLLVEPPSAPPRGEPQEPSFPEPPPAEPAPPESPSAPEPPAESESLEDLMAEEEESGPPEGADTAVPPPPPPPPEAEAAARPDEEPAGPVEPSEPLPELTDEPPAEAAEAEAGPEPPPPPPPAATEGQRGRARGRADVPTQEHIPPRRETGDAPSVPSEPEPPLEEPGPQLYDFETDPGLLEEEGVDPGTAPPPAEESDDFEALGPVDEAEEAGDDLDSDEEPYGEQRGGTTDFEEVEAVEGAPETDVRPAAPPEEDEEGYRTEVRPADPDDEEEDDLLSESPEFLEQDTDEGLWFEKGPPKDFDFEDDED